METSSGFPLYCSKGDNKSSFYLFLLIQKQQISLRYMQIDKYCMRMLKLCIMREEMLSFWL